ncbi:DUF2844 domain-containing protein [Paraburkholderia sp. MMS20-SJTR3]|uniref:DUF2844 domain-containing protein n=1 Tax=Paraburkholderia sejongensis TaxID=2886946 RepID=A0ABS8JTM9_9BURK|nr:DUF2844 domain-containing protein [Paraburkholderia sp. MMS20-SJTR3]MCC8393222.1 DUF2844 domain-containing protein [Paraburkholderia sp. MMS20-SJTR3]
MRSRTRRARTVAALVLPLSLWALSAAQPAHAALGGTPMTPPSDASVSSRLVQPASGASQSVMRSASGAAGSSAATSSSSSYTVRETALGNGTVVREYLDTSGAVFGLAWHGPQMPDLSELLGSYFPQYVTSVKAVRAARGNTRGPVSVDDSALVVHSGGHMGAFSGVAWLPAALPSGVSGSDIQ